EFTNHANPQRPAAMDKMGARKPHKRLFFQLEQPAACPKQEWPMTGALAGLRVLELARILAGPWARQSLAALSADVIKVSSSGPPQGDGGPHPGLAAGLRRGRRRQASRRRLFPRHQPRQTVDRPRFRE